MTELVSPTAEASSFAEGDALWSGELPNRDSRFGATIAPEALLSPGTPWLSLVRELPSPEKLLSLKLSLAVKYDWAPVAVDGDVTPDSNVDRFCDLLGTGLGPGLEGGLSGEMDASSVVSTGSTVLVSPVTSVSPPDSSLSPTSSKASSG